MESQGLEPEKISHEFKFKDFAEALNFANKVGEIAESLNHHPEILIKWGYVKVDYWTHSSGGITELDHQAMKQVKKLAQELSN